MAEDILKYNKIITKPSVNELPSETLENAENASNLMREAIDALDNKVSLLMQHVNDVINLVNDIEEVFTSENTICPGVTTLQLDTIFNSTKNAVSKITYDNSIPINLVFINNFINSISTYVHNLNINVITSKNDITNIRSLIKTEITELITNLNIYIYDICNYEYRDGVKDNVKYMYNTAKNVINKLEDGNTYNYPHCYAYDVYRNNITKSENTFKAYYESYSYKKDDTNNKYYDIQPHASLSLISTYRYNTYNEIKSSILSANTIAESYVAALTQSTYETIDNVDDYTNDLIDVIKLNYTSDEDDINTSTAEANKTLIDLVKSIAMNWYTGGKSWLKSCATDGVWYTIKNTATDGATNAWKFVSSAASDLIDIIKNPRSQESYDTINDVLNYIDGYASIVENSASLVVDNAVKFGNTVGDYLKDIATSYANSGSTATLQTFGKAVSMMSQSLVNYVDGITETAFGSQMEKSWRTDSDSFVNTFYNKNNSSYKVKFLTTSPLDPGDNASNLYGTMMLGTPPMFTNTADPNSRAYINSFLKDAKFLSLTPGLPKYSGGAYDTLMGTSNLYNQTKNGETQLQYLLHNGIDSYIANKDKRYYSFQANYEEYFAYLETMLNAIRIKMGLATEDSKTYSLYSFIDPSNNKLRSKYNNSLGFFINPAGMLSELIDSSQSSFGSEQAGRINDTSASFRRTNYLTGMGTGSGWHNASRMTSNVVETVIGAKNNLAEFTKIGQSFFKAAKNVSGSNIVGLAAFAAGTVLDAARYPAQNDTSALLQQYMTQNGMKVMYPELWEDSNYSKNVNVNFEFISPYGDPESIFEHVMVPFCALLCFAMPRQADFNGLVNPFFVRADVSGLFSIDLGLITNISFTRGGNSDLWSKDGLPLAISGSIQITDLYPFLAMTKRISYLSANPNYTSFLNSFAGLHTVSNSEKNTNGLNEYFRQLLNRVSGLDNMPVTKNLWNSFSQNKRKSLSENASVNRVSKLNALNKKSITFIRK